MDSGWVKVRNFRHSQHKLGYAYRLTPSGVRERARATLRMLRRKSAEYEALKEEIARLEADARQLGTDMDADAVDATP